MRAISSSSLRGEPHVLGSDHKTKPFPLHDLRSTTRPRRYRSLRGGGQPFSTMIAATSVCRDFRSSVFDLLPPMLQLKPMAGRDWLEALLKRMVTECELGLPGQMAALSRMTEMLFFEVSGVGPDLCALRRRMARALRDPHIGKALQLIHERPDHLGLSASSAARGPGAARRSQAAYHPRWPTMNRYRSRTGWMRPPL